MITRNILDPNGVVIGTLTLPDGTPEDTWTSSLAPYATNNPAPTIPANIDTVVLSQTNTVSTSASTPSVIGGMSTTPPAGKYIVLFNGSISTAGASASGQFGIYVDGVLLTETVRPISCNLQLLGGLVTVSLNSIGLGTYTGSQVSVNGTQPVEVKFNSTNGGTIAFSERVLTLIKVS